MPPLARLGVMRLGASRLGTFQPWLRVLVAGVDRTADVRIAGAGIEQVLNHETDTASFRVSGFTPVQGQEVVVQFGDARPSKRLFAGHIQQVKTVYELDNPANLAQDVECVDYTWLLNKRKVTAHYLSESATDIVLAIVAGWTSGFITANVVADLPAIDEITFTNEDVADALSRIAERIGAYWYVDYAKDIHFFLSEDSGTIDVTDAHGRIMALTQSVDLSQVITRVIAHGGGSNAAVEVTAGSAELPVEDAAWYATDGGEVLIGTQRVTYTGLSGTSSGGALVGTGNAPTSPPTLQNATGTSHTAGAVYRYGVTFITGSGESTPSPVSTITPPGGTVTNPMVPTARSTGAGSGVLTVGGSYRWRVVLFYRGGGHAVSTPTPAYTADNKLWEVYVGAIATSGGLPYYLEGPPAVAEVVQTQLYRTTNGGSTYYLESTIAGVVSNNGYVDQGVLTDALLVGQPTLPANDAELRAVYLADVPTSGNTAVTSRTLYRTVANGSQLKVLDTLADNTTTTYVDQIVDGALGADAPTSDTSGQDDNRQVGQGETTLPISSTIPFATAGWVLVGSLPVRYTGISGHSLTGIPASGLGALTSTVRYGTQVIVMPRLTGIPPSGAGAVAEVIGKGDQVNVLVERNDTAAQTALAAIMGGDGIIEGVIVDGRLSEDETRNRADALLAERKDPHVTLTFTTRSPSFVVGRTVTFNLTTPLVTGTYQIQAVRIAELAFDGALMHVFPLRTVEASSRRFTFEDFLRQIRQSTQRR